MPRSMNPVLSFVCLVCLSLPAPALPASVTDCRLQALAPAEIPKPVEETPFAKDQEQLRTTRALKGALRKQALKQYSAPRKKTLFERATVIFDWVMASVLGLQAAHGLSQDPQLALQALILAPPVLYVADFLSQVFHKYLDSYASEKSPVWGAATREFRKHHEDPNNLNDVPYVDHLVAFAKPMAPAFLATAAASSAGYLDPVTGAEIWLAMVAILNTTEFHKQSHLKEPNLLFKGLQKLRLALTHEEHMRHHKPPYDGEYAVLNGWSNAGIRKLGLWQTLDRLFWKYANRLPNNWIQDPRSIPDSVVTELRADLDKIPPDLWHSGATNPGRIPSDLREPIAKAELRWQTHFLSERRALYHELIREGKLTLDEAEAQWAAEHEQFPYLYGTEPHPLQWETGDLTELDLSQAG